MSSYRRDCCSLQIDEEDPEIFASLGTKASLDNEYSSFKVLMDLNFATFKNAKNLSENPLK